GGAGGPGGGPDVDEGFAAHLAQEAVPFVLELALADGLADLGAAVLLAEVGLARTDALHDVPAGLALEGRGHFAVLQGRDLASELRPEGILREPAEVAAVLAGDGVVGIAGHRGEVLAAGDAVAHGLRAGARGI